MENLHQDDFFENRQKAEENKLKNQRVYQDFSKKKLMTSMKSKIKTTMIGAIVAFEESFGYIWGHGQTNITPEQQKMKEEWDKTRTRILNTGNNQIRNSEEEIAKYETSRKKDTITFIINKGENNG